MKLSSKEPLVCICIPSYNTAETLEETLTSLLANTYRNIIIKVIDNQSTDGTVDLVRRLMASDSRLHLIVNETNIGMENNFNKCVNMGEGDFLAIFHSDDRYHANMIAEQVKVFQQYPDVKGVFTHANIIDEKGQILSQRYLPPEFRRQNLVFLNFQDLFQKILKYSNFLVCPSAMIRTSVYQQSVAPFEGKKYQSSLDLGAWLKLSQIGQVALITQPLMDYRESRHSWTYRQKTIRLTPNHLFLVLEDYLDRPEVKHFLTNDDNKFFEFLKFKDNMLMSWNAIKSKKNQQIPKTNFNLGQALAVIFRTDYHRRFGLLACGIYFIRQVFVKILKN